MAQQRRSEQRIKCRLTARFRGSNGRERSAFTADLSPSGLYLSCAMPEAPGKRIDLVVELPALGEVQLAGRVAWTLRVPFELQVLRRGGFGVELQSQPALWARYFETLEQAAIARHASRDAARAVW